MQARIIGVIIILAIIAGGFFYIKNKDDQIKQLAEDKTKLEISLKSAEETIANQTKGFEITSDRTTELIKNREKITIVHDTLLEKSREKIRTIEKQSLPLDSDLSLESKIKIQEQTDTETSRVMIWSLWESYCASTTNQCESKEKT